MPSPYNRQRVYIVVWDTRDGHEVGVYRSYEDAVRDAAKDCFDYAKRHDAELLLKLEPLFERQDYEGVFNAYCEDNDGGSDYVNIDSRRVWSNGGVIENPIVTDDNLVHVAVSYPDIANAGYTLCEREFLWRLNHLSAASSTEVSDDRILAGHVPPEPPVITCLACLAKVDEEK